MTALEHANLAAAEITTELRQINDNLTATLVRRGNQLLAAIAERDAAIAERDALMQENARLRESLEHIRDNAMTSTKEATVRVAESGSLFSRLFRRRTVLGTMTANDADSFSATGIESPRCGCRCA